MKTHPEGYIKIEATAKINKNGEATNWQDLSDQSPEYWSEASFQDKFTTESYPQQSGETNSAYDERLKHIGATALDTTKSIQPGKYYPYTDISDQPKGTTVRGFKFEPYNPNSATKVELYNEVFASECAVSDEVKARKMTSLECTTPTPRIFESQKDVARFYIGALDYREQAKYQGKFQDVGSGRYTPARAKKVADCKADFLISDQYDDNVEDKIAGRMLEGLFYPFVRTGFFDSPDGAPAATILTSDYDDFIKKADVALFMPINIKGKDGENKIKYQPICLDLTIGHGDNKISKIHQNFDHYQGFTDIIYPSTCLQNDLPAMKEVPHFALCLPRNRNEFTQFCERLAAGKKPPEELCNLVNYEIYRQADYWMNHYAKQTTPDAREKFEIYKDLTSCFQKRLGLNDPNSNVIPSQIPERHPGATRFISTYMYS